MGGQSKKAEYEINTPINNNITIKLFHVKHYLLKNNSMKITQIVLYTMGICFLLCAIGLLIFFSYERQS